jgi:capsular polysaccharide biosynthesis protein
MEDEEVDLLDYLFVIRRNKWIIIVVTLLSIIISAVASFYFITPIYETSTSLIVSKRATATLDGSGRIQIQDVEMDRMLAETYAKIIKSRRVLDSVISKLGLNISATGLANKIQVTPEGNTEIINISVKDRDPVEAAKIANEVANSFVNNIIELMKIDNISIIDKANVPSTPVSPKKGVNIVVGGTAGFILSILLVFLKEALDRTIKTEDDIKDHLGLPILGIIPELEEKN